MVFEVKIITVFGASDWKAHRDSRGTGDILFLRFGCWLHEFIKIYTYDVCTILYVHCTSTKCFLENSIEDSALLIALSLTHSGAWFESAIAHSRTGQVPKPFACVPDFPSL